MPERASVVVLSVLCAGVACQQPATEPPQSSLADLAFAKLQRQYDKDKDGRIEQTEYPRGDAAFKNLDRDGDGAITRADFDGSGRGGARGPQGQRGKRPALPERGEAPKVGDLAPDFTLPLFGMKGTEVKLSSFRGKQPVALVFGSWT